MPKRTDIKKILLIGSGPIVIGQSTEFDYSGTQGAKALRDEGYDVVLVNSNPATIMTDPDMAQRTYVEPLTLASLTAIIEREKPEALLPTLGGQTALNLALALDETGVLSKHNVVLLGASKEAIKKAEDRGLFKQACAHIGLRTPKSGHAHSLEEARTILSEIGLPAILRPSFTLGGSGGGIVFHENEFDDKVRWALQQSPTHEVLIEQSVLGWKEYELEVICDNKGNFSVVCSIENIDPMGVHTGDSVTVAPAMTLTDREYQRLRNAAKAVMREIGVATGGANVQFAVHPETGEVVVVEMNPRVSRSSALASKATGYPIAKIAAKLAVGYTLDELINNITRTSAAFEPTLDYVVVKWPRFAFEKFPGADQRLGTQMKSVGEAMAIGRTFCEALQKAARSLETGRVGLLGKKELLPQDWIQLAEKLAGQSAPQNGEPGEQLRWAKETVLRIPNADRLFLLADCLRDGMSVNEAHTHSRIDRWFLEQMMRIVRMEDALRAGGTLTSTIATERLLHAKKLGFSDAHIARCLSGESEETVRTYRKINRMLPKYLRVDTCAAEMPTYTPYMYSSYEAHEDEDSPTKKDIVIILGGGPNRIGQGIEFDYCCVHAAFALRNMGLETVMVNCNPETVSTDYDTSDRLYFEPLTSEDVLHIAEREQARGNLLGVIVQLGGQTPLKLTRQLHQAGIPILGTSPESIDAAEDRARFEVLLESLRLRRPQGGIAQDLDSAKKCAQNLGFPLLVRPSYVLGGRAMSIVRSMEELERDVNLALEVSKETALDTKAERPNILLDQFLSDAIEVDVDALSDGEQVVIAGVMQHIEEAGIHSGDSACVLPPYSLSAPVILAIKEQTRLLARQLNVRGLMNIQFALRNQASFILEVNPRASRTIPFVSKATGVPFAKLAAQVMVGKSLAELQVKEVIPHYFSVKESVFPFSKFAGVDTLLGPEMRSTGEVMGMAESFGEAFGKATDGAGTSLPSSGVVLLSVRDEDKPLAIVIARRFAALGFSLIATEGTAHILRMSGLACETVHKGEADSARIVRRMNNNESDAIRIVFNTVSNAEAARSSFALRRAAITENTPYFTTYAAALAAVEALEQQATRNMSTNVMSLQEWHQRD